MKKYVHANLFLQIFLVLLILAGLSSMVLAKPSVTFQFHISPEDHRSIPRSPQIALSTDRGDGGFYSVGERVNLRYQATIGGYITLAQYNPGGSVQIIEENKFVRANSPQMVSFMAKEPVGTHRVVIIITPDTIPRNKIQEFLRNPSRISSIFGGQYAVNRTEFMVDGGQVEPLINVQPATFNLNAGSTQTFSIRLTDYSGRPIPGKNLLLDAPFGTLSSHQVRTNSRGMAIFTYTASFVRRSSVRISVLFPGDADHGWTSTEIVGHIR
ncbi:MAG: hypothetical protein GX428_05995 [Candidatus Atribacteria bacterium]|nr:hypothetical protein [Candidatus Atribacteria bacterium]